MKTIESVEKDFIDDVEKHKMEIINDDGVNRHIRFKTHGKNCCYFDLTTWAGHLCISGDIGTYVFSRVNDMFGFFRQKTLNINPIYWAEKCLSESTSCHGIKEFSEKLFEAAVMSEFSNYVQCMVDDVDLSDRYNRKAFGYEMGVLWEEIKEDIFCPQNEHDAIKSIYSFDGPEGLFDDFWEAEIMDYTRTFLWCLYAIVWGISKYDQKDQVT